MSTPPFYVVDKTGSAGRIEKENLDVSLTVFDVSRLLIAGEIVTAVGQFSLNSTPAQPSWQLTPYVQPPPAVPADTSPLVLENSSVTSSTQIEIGLSLGTPGITYVASFVFTTNLGRQKVVNFYVVLAEPVNPSMISSSNPSPSNTTMTVSGTASIPVNFQGSVFVENSSGAAIVVTLPPSPVLGQTVQGIDVTGNAATHTITWVGASGVTIDGAPSFVFSANNQSATFQWNGTNWSIL